MSASFAMHFADVAAQGNATFASTAKAAHCDFYIFFKKWELIPGSGIKVLTV
jgi:hypothetical protein